MQWLNPAGAWAFMALAGVLALYVLRKKAKRVPAPSLLLWRRMESQSLAGRPFQRLVSRLLLWLQLLAAALLALALMRPASFGGAQGETALIFDLSASMQTVSQGRSRLEEAKDTAYGILDGLRDEDAVTVIAAGSALGQSISRSTDHAAVRRAIAELKAGNGTADIDGAVALAQAMRRDLPSLQIVVLSDRYAATDDSVRVQAAGRSEPNRSILSLRLSEREGDTLAFAQVQNRGGPAEAQMECYADGVLCDVRTVSLEGNARTSVRFSAPLEAGSVMVRFAQPDALPADDARYAVRPEETERRVLLVTDENVFLERALSLRKGLTIVKAMPADALKAGDYDLYVYDRSAPATLPDAGAVLAIAPEGEVLGIAPQREENGGGALRAGVGNAGKAICEHLLLSEIALRAYRPLVGGEAAVTVAGNAVLAVSEEGSRRAAVLGFDLHDSNLPLKADFPVLIQNLLQYLLPDAPAGIQDMQCGSSLPLNLDERTVSARVRLPSGRTVSLEGSTLADTEERGLYTLTEERADGTLRETTFAAHIPSEEGETMSVASSTSGEAAARSGGGMGREWTPWLLLACFAVLMLEWEVSRRGA